MCNDSEAYEERGIYCSPGDPQTFKYWPCKQCKKMMGSDSEVGYSSKPGICNICAGEERKILIPLAPLEEIRKTADAGIKWGWRHSVYKNKHIKILLDAYDHAKAQTAELQNYKIKLEMGRTEEMKFTFLILIALAENNNPSEEHRLFLENLKEAIKKF